MSKSGHNELAERIRARLTLVFVNGTMTLHDGTVVDSRQLTNDEWVARAAGKALTASREWWDVVSSLALPTLRTGEFILVVGPRTIARAAVDGEPKRVSLTRVLGGSTGKFYVKRSGMNENLPEGYAAVAELRAGGGSMGQIGVHCDRGEAVWRFFDGNDYYLRVVASVLGPRVVVDTTGAFLEGAYGMTDIGTLALERKLPIATSPQVLILPDTPEMRGRANRLESGVIEARATSAMPPKYDETYRRDHRDHLRLAVSHAQCGVTGFFREGRWGDPANLEAARQFLQQRFDLRVGLWDLALNPALAVAVLEPEATLPAPTSSIGVPPREHERARRAADRAISRKGAGHRAEMDVVAALRPTLISAGWRVRDGNLSFPLTRPMSNWPNSPKFPLVELRFTVTKNSASVVAWQWFYNQLDITSFVDGRRDAFEAVAPLPGGRRDHCVVPLWNMSKGWAAPHVDWDAIAQELAVRSGQWRTLLAEFVEHCEAVRRKRFTKKSDEL